MDKPVQVVGSGYIFLVLMGFLALLEGVKGDPRAKTVNISCGHQLEHNGTIYVSNFVATMENISEQMRDSGFGTAVTGSGLDTNYGLAQCYGYLSSLDCVLCYAEARTVLPQCYPFNGGRIFLDGCFMRAENYSFFEEHTGPDDRAVCGNTSRKGLNFQESARQAVTHAVAAALGNEGYAKAQVAVSGTNESAYVLANCWRTLNNTSCKTCLENASASVLGCLSWSEGRALNTGCFIRYSDTDFLNKEPGNGISRGTVIIIVVSIVSSLIVLAIGVAIGVYIWKYRYIQKKRRGSNDAEKFVKLLHDSNLNFKYSTLDRATGSFNDANKLGQGGFGTGVLPDGREIAVKRLFFNSRHRAADFYHEVKLISSVEHKNLVRLLGCSCSGPESLLVYEFLPNKSLDRFIFDPSRGKLLDWEKRYIVIIGTVEGLVYLHENSETKIIHRDIKASNILLDSKLRAKIADFGLARSFQEDQSHISTAIAGTLGYMAPEYLAHGQLTEKADVYSFGVILLEIVTGKQNNKSKATEYSDSIVTVLGTVEEIYDPNLMLHNDNHGSNFRNEIFRVVQIGLLCTQEIPSLRPSMSKFLLRKMIFRTWLDDPRIADFGLVRLFPEDKTHISTAIAGTLGYMAPEYAVRGMLTQKADVYSFGVLIIEITCRKRNKCFSPDMVCILHMLREVVDPVIEHNFREKACRLLQIGLLCVQASTELRPSMSTIVQILTDDTCEIPCPTQPPFLSLSSSGVSLNITTSTNNYQTNSYIQSSGYSTMQSRMVLRWTAFIENVSDKFHEDGADTLE
ncbi:cysteine-rich receptor-like protein kinase 2 isoform X1 [Gossypium australe]|uniref:Cysteine-rich receptor-like protein kinase 2 isoform X1 n=1 Tax=Gossypium australe TaxID=47621 RepID=A0A5B6V0I5_9ROSI|nr:cysteine-rich receptor-like protein kinase 2 isoform X1 [Gossypium australe]